jgi:DNA-binding NarL/FixJ family response regulator
MSHQAAGDRVFAALARSYGSILAEVTAHEVTAHEVTAHQSDAEFCPFCGGPLDEDQPASSDIMLRATLPEHIAAALMRTPMLSPRELAVFELLGLGYDNRSLARTLHVSERTAKRHVTAILAKLGLESRLQAGLAALLTTSLRPANDDPGSNGGPKVAWTDLPVTDDTGQ